jgi:hypothetical protein
MNQYLNESPYQFQTAQPFSYNPETDPTYQAALATARQNIAQQQANTNAFLRARGQGRSSYSERVANQIGAQEMARVSNEVLPQLISQAYQRYMDQANRDLQVQQLNYGAQQDRLANLANLYALQNQQYFENPMREAQLTGNYLPGEARQYINAILGLKQQAEAPGITREQRDQLSQQADMYRQALRSLGVNPALFGADVTASQAAANVGSAGVRTLEGLARDLAERQANLNAALAVGEATGRLISPQEDWSGLFRQATRSDTPLNLAGQQFQSAEDQRRFSNEMILREFNENVRQFGLEYALRQAAQDLDRQRLLLQEDDNARQWAALEASLAGAGSGGDSTGNLTANQLLQSIRSLYSVDGQLPTDEATREQMALNVIDAGLSDAQTNQVLAALGFSKSEIDRIVKKYGGNG